MTLILASTSSIRRHMLDLLHAYHFDWELYSAQSRPTPLVWADLPQGVYGQYVGSQNVVKLSRVLQKGFFTGGTLFDACYGAETRAFVNEANFWQMLNGPRGKAAPDALELQENAKMYAFVGNSGFADLVLRTTASYVKECGS